MSATTDVFADAAAPSQARLNITHADVHVACVACGAASRLGLRFAVAADGSVAAEAVCPASLQGYAGLVQGGVVAAILDSAMTNCLFARGIVAVTAELVIRYREPTLIDRATRVRAWLATTRPPLYRLEAELTQAGRVTARARATFVRRSPPPSAPPD